MLILNKILVVYPYKLILILLIRGSQFFRNEMCNVTYYKSYGSGLADVTYVGKRVVNILDGIFGFICQ